MTADAGLTGDTTQWVSPTEKWLRFARQVLPELAGMRRPLRYLAWWLARKGFSIPLGRRPRPRQAFFDAMHWLDDTTGIIFGDAVGDCLTMSNHQCRSILVELPCDALPDKVHGEAAFAASNGNIASAGDTVVGGHRRRSFEGVALA